MNKTIARILTVALLAVTFVSAANTTLARKLDGSPYLYSFEKTTDPWQIGFEGPALTNGTLDVQRENCPTVSGCNTYAAITAQGSGAWMWNSFPAEGSNVTISWQMRNIDSCKGCVPLVYIGSEQPKSLSDFQMLDDVLQDGNWPTYYYEGMAPATTPVVYVAIGYMNPDPAAQQVVVGVDNISVQTGN